MRSLDAFASQKLAALDVKSLRRRLSPTRRYDGAVVERDGKRLISFSCNDYLNLSQHPSVRAAAAEASLAVSTTQVKESALEIEDLRERNAALEEDVVALRASSLFEVSVTEEAAQHRRLGAYASSKFALEGMSESWRHELRPFDIDVYLVEPGPYRTDIWGRNRTLADTDADGGPYGEISARVEERLMAMVQQSMREPDEVITRIMTLLEGPRTRLRHPMGPGAVERKLAKLLPFSVTERGVRKKLMK